MAPGRFICPQIFLALLLLFAPRWKLMAAQRKLFIGHASELAHLLVRAVRPDGLVASFAKSYARQHGREGVVDEPARVQELESTMGREAVLVMVAEVYRLLPGALGARKGRPLEPEEAAFAEMFWPEFLASLGRVLEWPAAEITAEREALERDLLMYRRWTERTAFPGAAPVTQSGISPFYDRCALLLDPSMMEEARRAAADFEKEVTSSAARIIGQLGRTPVGKSRAGGRPSRSRTRMGPKSRRARQAKRSAKRSKRRPRR